MKTTDYDVTKELLSRQGSGDNVASKGPVALGCRKNSRHRETSGQSSDKDTSGLLRRNLEIQ